MTLSAIQAIQRGRKQVPEFISGMLVKLTTHKGLSAWWDNEYEGWVYEDPLHGWEPHPLEHEPDIGSACMLGAQAIAMGIDLAVVADDEYPYYVHPDFIPDAKERGLFPNGYTYNTQPQTRIAMAKPPCTCPPGHIGGNNQDGLLNDGMWPIPELIAHLNDQHDPRSDSASAAAAKDPWSEQRIIEWLRGMGYNGGHA